MTLLLDFLNDFFVGFFFEKKKEKEKEKEGVLPVRGLGILKAARRSGAPPATQTW